MSEQNKTSSQADRLLYWLPRLVGAASLFIMIVCATYFYNFKKYGISDSQDHWGQFGDFVGGVSNPVLSFFALIALALTVALQSKQLKLANEQLLLSKKELEDSKEELKLSRKVSENQLKHFEQEAKKNDIYRTIRVLEDRLENLYKEPVYLLLNDKLECWQLYLLLSHGTDNVLTKVPRLTVEPPAKYHAEIMQTKGVLTRLHVTLVKLSVILTSLSMVDDSDELMFFYEPTIAHLARQLKKTGYLPEDDEQSIKISMEFRNQMREGRRKFSQELGKVNKQNS